MTTTDQPTPAQARPERSKIVEAVAAIADQAKSVADCPANKRGDSCEYCERDAKEALNCLHNITAHESAQHLPDLSAVREALERLRMHEGNLGYAGQLSEYHRGINSGIDKALAILATPQAAPSEIPPLEFNVEGSLEAHLKASAISLGKPLVRASFPGPKAHELTPEEYAFEIGKVEIGCALGLIEVTPVEDIDGHLPKIRFDEPFPPAEAAVTPQAAQEDLVEQRTDERPHRIIAQPMDSADLERVTGMATLDVGIPYRAGGTIGLFPSTVRALLGHIAWLEQSKPEREYRLREIATVEETCAGPKLNIDGVRVMTWFGTAFNEKAHEIAAAINTAANRNAVEVEKP